MTQKRIIVMEDFPFQLSVIEERSAPPASPTAGDRYIVDPTGSGDFSGHDNKIAWRDASAWHFDVPVAGWKTWNQDLGRYRQFNGTVWQDVPGATGQYINRQTTATVVGNIPTWDNTTGDEIGTGYPVETNLETGSDLETKLARADAIKTYVDALLGANDAMVYKGVIDCSANPNYPAADAGHTYKVSVAGHIGGDPSPAGDDGQPVEVGDMVICITDATTAGTHAVKGSEWNIIQVNIDGAVTSSSASSTDGAIAIFDSTSGQIIKDGGTTLATVTGHIADATKHFTEDSIDHTAIDNIGTRTHANIDTHIGAHARHRTMTYSSTYKAIIYEESNESF